MIQSLLPSKAVKPSKVGQQHFRISEDDLPKFEFSGRMIESVTELESLAGSWQRLGEMTLSPNPFFDQDFLIPAFKHLSHGDVSVLVVEAQRRKWPDGPRVLCALMPLKQRSIYGFPLSCLEIWKHDQCFNTTPWIRRDCAAEVLGYVFDYLKQAGASLFSCNTVLGEGEFQRVLTDVLGKRSCSVFHRSAFNRACFRPNVDAETYINTSVSKNTRKGTRRMARKLASMGQLSFANSDTSANPQPWIDEFLGLESAGWKGHQKTAFECDANQRSFFTEMVTQSMAAGKLSMLKVQFDESPIAMLCDLQQGQSGAHFKTTFDESYADYSPGLISELKHVERLHSDEIEVMDSCADPNHSMINRVWSDQIRYQNLVIALGGWRSRFAVSLMPILQTINELVKSRSNR